MNVMKIKNLKCYALSAMIIANSSFMLSCDVISDKYEEIRNKDFYAFLDENNIVPIEDLRNVTRNYYEAEVCEFMETSDGIIETGSHYEKIDDIDDVVCQGREFDYDYKVLKVDSIDGQFEVTSEIVEDIDYTPVGYDYVYADDYVITNGYRDVLINYGKVLKR